MKLENNRPIIKGKVGDKEAYFLLDTGASLALIDSSLIDKYNLIQGNKFPGTIVGTGGVVKDTYYCTNNIIIENKSLEGFILMDISSIRNSILRETDIEILGIISYTLMLSLRLIMDLANNKIYGV